MSLLDILIVLVIVGVVLHLVNTYILMAPQIKKILNFVVILFVCLWLLQEFGLLNSLGIIHVGQHR